MGAFYPIRPWRAAPRSERGEHELGLQPAQEPREHAAQGLLAIGVIGAAGGEHGDRHAIGAAHEQGDLMVDQPRARAPSTLEVQPPAVRAHLADAPPLLGDDRAEQAHGRRAMASDDVRLEVQEEARLL
jgi:hypothetical protein